MNCPKCGLQIYEHTEVCPQCGKDVRFVVSAGNKTAVSGFKAFLTVLGMLALLAAIFFGAIMLWVVLR